MINVWRGIVRCVDSGGVGWCVAWIRVRCGMVLCVDSDVALDGSGEWIHG